MTLRLWLFLLLIIFFILGGFWQPYDVEAINIRERHLLPGGKHLLGTDHLGRDLLSRIMAGGWRTACVIFLAGGIGFVAGTLLGSMAAIMCSPVKTIILRMCEFFIMVPTLIVALVFTAIFGLSPMSAGLALGLAGVGPQALFSHSLARRVLAQPFIFAAHSLGGSKGNIIWRHLLPNILPTCLIHMANQAGFAVTSYAALAFIGLGSHSAKPDWGSMLFEYRIFIFDNPNLVLCPGMAIAMTILILNATFRKL